ncbi:type II/IV secretion system protein, partial [Candidatus Kaiserbacteria bacterium]|nr:type II/IV secretion system protein [Candidatus Kaiserbacteria bacterium]
MNLLGLLVDKGLLSKSDRAALEAELAKKERSLADLLAERGIPIAKAFALAGETYGLPVRTLDDPPANKEVFKYIPVDSARHYGFVPLDMVEGALEIGITDPDNIEAFDALQFISGKIGIPYKITLITKEDFDRVIEEYRNLSGEVGRALSEYETVVKSTAAALPSDERTPILVEESLSLPSHQETISEGAPVTKIVSTILRYAIDGRSSDIHIEPAPEKTRVRFRVDGQLYTSLELPEKVHEAVITRIKILSKLRLDEKRKPQDGRFSATVDGHRIDFRVSTFPTEYGEKVEMRILDQSDATATLESVGFTGANLASVREMMKSPFGIILIAGPTGSGKSTTLFAMLSELDREAMNVVSLEDPVEYEISGVAQSQVRPEIGYTFASGLRSILRQDPDIIMVGEIRDKETATLAVQAALTGHLVLSTIHTNTAVGAIPRLVDMGIDPFLIAPTLIAVIGQRLVRKVCPGASKPFLLKDNMKASIEQDFADLPLKYRSTLPPLKEFYRAVPTDECPTGTRGRTAVFEILHMDKKIEEVILEEPVENKIYAAARSNGMLTMREDAIIKALAGEIPFEEINTL